MSFISIGSNCSPKANIEKFIAPAEKNFFDYTYQDFNCVVQVLKNIDDPTFFLNPSDFRCVQNNIVHLKQKFLSMHDKPQTTSFEEYLPIFIETYARRSKRLKKIILQDDKIFFLYFISPESLQAYKLHPVASDIPTPTEAEEFLNIIHSVNPNVVAKLVFLVPPTLQSHFQKTDLLKQIENVCVYYFTDDKTQSDWKMQNYDWSVMFDYLKSL